MPAPAGPEVQQGGQGRGDDGGRRPRSLRPSPPSPSCNTGADVRQGHIRLRRSGRHPGLGEVHGHTSQCPSSRDTRHPPSDVVRLPCWRGTPVEARAYRADVLDRLRRRAWSISERLAGGLGPSSVKRPFRPKEITSRIGALLQRGHRTGCLARHPRRLAVEPGKPSEPLGTGATPFRRPAAGRSRSRTLCPRSSPSDRGSSGARVSACTSRT
jgi:hypothetical protein